MFHHRIFNLQKRNAGSSVLTLANSYSLEYSGVNGYVNLGQPANLNFNPQVDSFTISLWFKPTVADNQRCLLAKASMGSADGISIFFGIQTNNIYCLVGGGGNNTSGGDISDLNWHMMTLTVTGRYCKIIFR